MVEQIENSCITNNTSKIIIQEKLQLFTNCLFHFDHSAKIPVDPQADSNSFPEAQQQGKGYQWHTQLFGARCKVQGTSGKSNFSSLLDLFLCLARSASISLVPRKNLKIVQQHFTIITNRECSLLCSDNPEFSDLIQIWCVWRLGKHTVEANQKQLRCKQAQNSAETLHYQVNKRLMAFFQ